MGCGGDWYAKCLAGSKTSDIGFMALAADVVWTASEATSRSRIARAILENIHCVERYVKTEIVYAEFFLLQFIW